MGESDFALSSLTLQHASCFPAGSGILVSAGRDTTVKVWNAESGALLRDLQGEAALL